MTDNKRITRKFIGRSYYFPAGINLKSFTRNEFSWETPSDVLNHYLEEWDVFYVDMWGLLNDHDYPRSFMCELERLTDINNFRLDFMAAETLKEWMNQDENPVPTLVNLENFSILMMAQSHLKERLASLDESPSVWAANKMGEMQAHLQKEKDAVSVATCIINAPSWPSYIVAALVGVAIDQFVIWICNT